VRGRKEEEEEGGGGGGGRTEGDFLGFFYEQLKYSEGYDPDISTFIIVIIIIIAIITIIVIAITVIVLLADRLLAPAAGSAGRPPSPRR